VNIILAQLRKDIQCQRGLLIAWAICAGTSVLPAAFIYLFPLLNHFPHANAGTVMVGVLTVGGIAMASAFSVGFGMLLLLPLLVIRIVHEDVLMGTTAFWLTRPLPREKLLGAKALLISALLVPLILLAGIMNASLGAGHFWIAELAWIAAFAAIASITSGARDFMIYAVALLFGKGVFAGILEKLWSYLHGGNISLVYGGIRQLPTFAREFHLTASDFYHLAYFGGFTAVFIHQYLTIKTKNSVAILIAVIVVVSLLQMLGGMPANSSGAP
jgi:hypothetical protein